MIQDLPVFIAVVFILTTLTTLWIFYRAVAKSAMDNATLKANYILWFIMIWLTLQAILSMRGFYLNTKTFPPRFILATFPALLTIIILFITKRGRSFIDNLPLKHLTYLSTVRIPVELVLLWLCINKAVPQLMTFEGRNFDILAGITAPFVAYYGFTKQKLSRNLILFWNYICLALLLNIVVNAVLSAPFPFQQFAFDQPNIAILYFPFIWLPAFVVPVVLFGHLVSLRQLHLNRDKK